MYTRYLVLLLCLLSALACQREHRQNAGVDKMRGAPNYESSPQISKTPAEVHVASVAPSLEKAPVDGAALYAQSCIACHQATGQGIPGVFPPLANSEYVTGDNVERLVSIMVYGLNGPVKVAGVDYNSAMAGFGAQFDDESLAAIATYVRSSWGNSAAPVDATVVSAARKKWGSRGPFTIDELGAE